MPKRKSTQAEQPAAAEPSRRRSTRVSQAQDEDAAPTATSSATTPSATEDPVVKGKLRGRPSRKSAVKPASDASYDSQATEVAPETSEEPEVEPESEPEPPAKRRTSGRQRRSTSKAITEPAKAQPEPEVEIESEPEPEPRAKRDRPPTRQRQPKPKTKPDPEEAESEPKEESESEEEPPAKRTRRASRSSLPGNASKTETEPEKTTDKAKPAKKQAAKSAGTKQKTRTSKAKATADDTEEEEEEEIDGNEDNNEQRNYWLLKAEPETRITNGVDVKFSIDDLADKTVPEPWDGIRNYVARNNLRAMKKGDLAFFYHSNCKEPAIVGTMEIVQEHSPDLSAHDPEAPYYDAKSKPEDPKWSVVHVEFRSKFAEPIGLKELRTMGGAGKPLERMQMLQQSRLSVSKVSKEEWEYLMGIAEERGKSTTKTSATKKSTGKKDLKN